MHWMGISDLTYADYRPLMQVNADAAAIIVRQDAPWKTVDEFIAHIKLNGASADVWHSDRRCLGLGTSGFSAGCGSAGGCGALGSNPRFSSSLVELMGGHIDAVVAVSEAAAQVEARSYVSSRSCRRSGWQRTGIPTLRESGIEWQMVGWRGLVLPRETPDAIVENSFQCPDGNHPIRILPNVHAKEWIWGGDPTW